MNHYSIEQLAQEAHFYIEKLYSELPQNIYDIDDRPYKTVAIWFIAWRAKLLGESILAMEGVSQLSGTILVRSLNELVIDAWYLALFDCKDNKLAKRYVLFERFQSFSMVLKHYLTLENGSTDYTSLISRWQSEKRGVFYTLKENKPKKVKQIKMQFQSTLEANPHKALSKLCKDLSKIKSWNPASSKKLITQIGTIYEGCEGTFFDKAALNQTQYLISALGNQATHNDPKESSFYCAQSGNIDLNRDRKATGGLCEMCMFLFRYLQEALFQAGFLTSSQNENLEKIHSITLEHFQSWHRSLESTV